MRSNLETLARLCGVSVEYADVWGVRQRASSETLLRILQLLGLPLQRPEDAEGEIRRWRLAHWQEVLPPVSVVWEGGPAEVKFHLAAGQDDQTVRGHVALEQGGSVDFATHVSALRVRRQRVVEGVCYQSRVIGLPGELPHGYHRLTLEIGNRLSSGLLIATPARVYQSPRASRLWGVFLPLYALHRKPSRSAGDFSDLEALMRWTAERGGNLVATLPLLATLWELTDDPSPYNPASRLFWNEFYLDPRRIPEFQASSVARQVLQAADEPASVWGRPPGELVDYSEQMQRKRAALEAIAADFFSAASTRREDLERHCRENPELDRFARFRAVGERQGGLWPTWSQRLRDGNVEPADYDESVFQYHRFTQWQVDQQLTAMKQQADQLNLLWYLDFPLGVSDAGFDVWREGELFIRGASGGAPPDSFFTKGQDWGFPPMHPQRLRKQEYCYFISALRTHLRQARVLRFDHVMSLYRFYWIPHGFSAREGTYVRYPMQEMFAILALESHRFGARIVGENLGTVPPAVDEALARHGVLDMYVLQYETNPEKGATLRPVPQPTVASVNTHDMPHFAAYWQGLDIVDRVDLGLLTPLEAGREQARRARLREDLVAFLQAQGLLSCEPPPETLEVLEACQAYLSSSQAEIVLVNLEDLWSETEPQNTPGTFRERPNWRHRARYAFDDFRGLPAVERILETVNRRRRGQQS